MSPHTLLRIVLMVVLLIALISVFISPRALGADRGQYSNSDPAIRGWFKSLKNKDGVPCCDYSDGHRTDEERRANAYWVPIEGAWHRVPDEAVIANAMNPTGQAVVWYGRYQNQVYIRCFVPGPST